MRVVDRTGQIYGRLTVLHRSDGPLEGETYWLCRCACGEELSVTARNLRSGNSKSCGCLQREQSRARWLKHGLKHTVEYETWTRAKSRCFTPENKAFRHYGARGITMCARWRDDFQAFLADMGPRPGEGYSLDRINNDGPYSPENCRWATRVQQARNKRTNRPVGDFSTVTAAAEAFRLNPGTAHSRMTRGFDVARIKAEVGHNRGRMVTWRGETHSVAEWSRRLSLNAGTIFARLRYGWPIDRVLGQPADATIQIRKLR